MQSLPKTAYVVNENGDEIEIQLASGTKKKRCKLKAACVEFLHPETDFEAKAVAAVAELRESTSTAAAMASAASASAGDATISCLSNVLHASSRCNQTTLAQGVLVELCCGTKSVGRVFEHFGIRTIAVDFDPQWDPDVQADIAPTPPEELFRMIHTKIQEKFGRSLPIAVFWASPQCTEYSQAKMGASEF